MKRLAAETEEEGEQGSKKLKLEDGGSDAKLDAGKKVWLSKKDRKAQKKQRQRSESVAPAGEGSRIRGEECTPSHQAPPVPSSTSASQSAPQQPASMLHAPAGKARGSKQKKAKKDGGSGGSGGAVAAARPEVEAIIASLSDRTAGTLSDRLNPDHPSFDAAFKEAWKTVLSKKERALVVQRDLNSMAAHKAAELAATVAVKHPFPVNEDGESDGGRVHACAPRSFCSALPRNAV
jgi:hypothetical protein